MKRFVVAAAFLTALAAASASAHEIHHTVTYGDTIVVELTHGSGAPFAGERYEVFRPGESDVFQAGVTDRQGRIAFAPDRDGDWRVRAFSADGHGVDLVVAAAAVAAGDGAPAAAQPANSRAGRGARIFIGVVILFAVFAVAALFLRRRSRAG